MREGSLEELTLESCRYEILVSGNLLRHPGIMDLVQRLGGTITLNQDGLESRIELPTRRPQLVQPVVDALRRDGWLLLAVIPARQSLEELFMEAIRTGGKFKTMETGD